MSDRKAHVYDMYMKSLLNMTMTYLCWFDMHIKIWKNLESSNSIHLHLSYANLIECKGLASAKLIKKEDEPLHFQIN